jgi:orotate phosphoribosyltransferase
MTDKIQQSLHLNASTDLTSLRQSLLDLFCQLGLQRGDFVLSSGQRSSYYINGKQVTLHPQGALALAVCCYPNCQPIPRLLLA